MNILRRLPLSRLLLLCGLVVGLGISATAIASAVGSGSKPPAKSLAEAVHGALSGPSVEGVSANITLTNRLLEGANLASGNGQAGGLASSPLVKGGSGRLWVAKDGRVRLELQAEKGDTEIYYDGNTVTMFDAASNTVYRYTLPAGTQKDASTQPDTSTHPHEIPSVTKVEEAISDLKKNANVSEATPANVGGQPAYTVRVSPKESGSLLGAAELSFDAAHGLPLRAALYSSTSPSSPVIELAASEVTYGPVEASVFSFAPPPGAKVEDLGSSTSAPHATSAGAAEEGSKPTVTGHGKGLTTIGVLESKAGSNSSNSALEGLPKVNINGVSASELRTELGTILTFERSGVRFVLAGSVTPTAIEALARGL